MLEFDLDVESDLHRFHGLWVDLDEDEYDGLSAERLFSLCERLAAYDGALAARIHRMEQEEKRRNPSRETLERNPDAAVVDNVHALNMTFGGELFEIEQV